jgi:RimJ/RimL family protein N-acetyltransferase
MAARPIPKQFCGRVYLAPYQSHCAELIVSWIRTAEEAFWLAPKTKPPITPEKLRGWCEPGSTPYLLIQDGRTEPVGYGELNILTGAPRQYWLGHLTVDAALRGQGLGLELTRALLREAFVERGAKRVTLVVFPGNTAAVACYRAAGMYDDGYEWHNFPAYGRREWLLRLAMSQLRWQG